MEIEEDVEMIDQTDNSKNDKLDHNKKFIIK